MASTAAIPALSTQAWAQGIPESRQYSIPAGLLSQALPRFAAEAGIQVSIQGALVSGIETAGIQGNYSVESGFAELLRGTGLEAVRQASGSYTLRSVAATHGFTLEAIEVQAISPDDARKDDAWRTAGSALYLSRDDIERSRGTSVGDIFKGATGVLVGENRNSGGLDVNIRGMQGQGRVPILVDGSRQETTVYRGYSGVASRSYIDPDLIGGINIDKGPTLSAQGTGANGGLVSMRTIGVNDIITSGESFGIRVRGTAIGNNSGSPVEAGTSAGLYTGGKNGASPVYRTDCANEVLCSGQYALPTEWGNPEGMDRPDTFEPKSWAGSVVLAKRWEKFDLVAAYAQRQQGNYYAGTHGPSAWVDVSDTKRTPFYTEVYPTIEGASIFQAGERIPGSNFESRSTLVKGTAYLTPDQDLELSFRRYKSAYAEIMPSQITRLSNFFPVSQPRDSEVTVDTYTSRYHWVPANQPLIDFSANLWHTRTSSINNRSDSDVFAVYNEREKYLRWGTDLENISSLQHGKWGESQLRYGLAYQTEDVSTVSLLEGDDTGGRNGDRNETSFFFSWQYKPMPSLTLDAGLRHTRFRSHDSEPITLYADTTGPNEIAKCLDADGDGQCDQIPNKNRQSGTAPVVSIAWEPWQRGLQFYARYAEAYRMPSLFESTSGFSFNSKSDIILKPEHSTNREVGINFLKDDALFSNDRLRLKLAYFRNQTRDYLTRTSANLWESGASEGSNWYDFTLRNIDLVRFHGVEFSGSYDMGAVFSEFGVTKYNKIEVCYVGSYRVNECNNYGISNSYLNNMIPPRWHGNLTLGTRLLQRKLTVGVRAVFMGQRTNAPRYNDDTSHGLVPIVPWHAYKVFDLFGSYKINDNLSVDLNIDNFTDRYYLDALSLGLIPAPGRTARMSLTLQY
ncbi:TonB-dependent receptor [Kerstersia gyiorum]|uniref:TonB-dependent receptor n=1 Tax=Kerstersia gyiorum TaxID=206506 RepID=UPI0030D5FD42